MARRRRTPLADRFWSKVNKTETCWLWTASTANGYGNIHAGDRKMLSSHRVSYELHYGTIPAGMVVDHKCHNTLCVNPDHLRLATTKQNGENQRRESRCNKKSGLRGVTYDPQTGKWRASATHNGRRHYAGYHVTVAEAAQAARELRNRLFTHNDADRKAA